MEDEGVRVDPRLVWFVGEEDQLGRKGETGERLGFSCSGVFSFSLSDSQMWRRVWLT
jgi:hypothetical protein